RTHFGSAVSIYKRENLVVFSHCLNHYLDADVDPATSRALAEFARTIAQGISTECALCSEETSFYYGCIYHHDHTALPRGKHQCRHGKEMANRRGAAEAIGRRKGQF